jgi:hypothetical protein
LTTTSSSDYAESKTNAPSGVGRKATRGVFSTAREEPINRTKQVISRHVALQAELVEKRLLHHRPFAHHRLNLPLGKTESGLYTASNSAFFNIG